MARLVLFFAGLVLNPSLTRGDGHNGKDSCPCVTALSIAVESKLANFPNGYGLGCEAHSVGVDEPPINCTGKGQPQYCSQPWCYVSANCPLGQPSILDNNHWYSFETCSDWTTQNAGFVETLLGKFETYNKDVRSRLEQGYAEHDFSDMLSLEPSEEMCPCQDCENNSLWNSKLNFNQTGMQFGKHGTHEENSSAVLMFKNATTEYMQIVNLLADSGERVGYLYSGHQSGGAYMSWPQEDSCGWGDDYDPRFRPWYNVGATGPKDVVIVTTATNSRDMVQKSTELILDTLGWNDFASIVLFNSTDVSHYSDHMVPVKWDTRESMKQWANGQSGQGGGANAATAMKKAMQIISESHMAGHSSMCQKSIFFLTNGEPEFSEEDYREISDKAREYNILIFTYSLGDGADRVAPKRLACENRGVFYPVNDTDPLKDVIARYFQYFTTGQEKECSNNFAHYEWVGHDVMSACMPFYDSKSGNSSLLGVTCMDVNLVEKITELKNHSGWNLFLCKASDITKKCRSLNMKDCHLQWIRRQYSEESVCQDVPDNDVTDLSTCQCRDRTCRDMPEFTDELHFFCDSWVGDNCSDDGVFERWGYSEAGKLAVRQFCKRSCNLCDYTACSSDANECEEMPFMSECRACLGKVGGVGIFGDPMTCPPDAPRDLMTTPTTPTDDTDSSSHCNPLKLLSVVCGATLLLGM